MGRKTRVLLTTSAPPSQSPFSTHEKRPPLGIGFLISVLRDAGHQVYFIDNYLQPSNFLENNYLEKNKIDFVGIYANTICLRDTLRMLYKIHYLRYQGKWKGKVIVGGPHATVSPDSFPEFVDHIVQGEGEQALCDIIEGKVITKLVRYPAIENLDDLPMPAWDYFARLPYDWTLDWLEKKPVFTMNTSRGCPFDCTFCSVGSIWGRQYSYFSAPRLVSDIEFLVRRYGVKGIYFREDNFTLNRKRLIEFCNLLIEKRIEISWACETRVNTLDEELMSLMYQSGARAFYLGVESGSQRILDFLKKGITVDQIKNAFALCREKGIKTAASVIMGVPTETEEDTHKTDILLKEIKPNVIWHNVFVGIPDSKLYRYVLENHLYEIVDDRGLAYLKGHNERAKRYYGNAWDSSIPFDTMNPKISVVMSVYNGERYVERAIRSILSQTYQNFEFVIIDDASTDRTLEILKNIGDPRIRVYTNRTNLGLTKSLNIAINHANGQYIARMDADDVSLPHRFDSQLAFLEQHQDYALVGSSYYEIDHNGQFLSLVKVLTEYSVIREGLKTQNWFGHGSIMMRKKAFVDVGGYDEHFKFSQDYDLWIRMAEKYKIGNIEEPLYCWRNTEIGISSDKKDEQQLYAQMAVLKQSKPDIRLNGKMNTYPLVSVLIPTYNRPTMLAESIRSVLHQTYNNCEIIVINDSGANVEHILAPLNKKGNIIYMRHGKNRGLAAARNTAITLSKGKYISYLDDDDIFFPHHIETLVGLLEKGNHDIVYSDAHRAFQKRKGNEYVISKRDIPYSCDFDYERILTENFIPVLCVIHKKECFQKAGLFDENLRRLEDWDLWIRMSRHYKFVHLKQVTCEFRWRDDGTSMMTEQGDAFAWANMNMLYKYTEYASDKPKIKKTHSKMVTDSITVLKNSLEYTLKTKQIDQVSIFGKTDIGSISSRLEELKDKYPNHGSKINNLIVLLHRFKGEIYQNTPHETLKDVSIPMSEIEVGCINGQDKQISLFDELAIKDEYIRAMETKIHRLDEELQNILKSNGWGLLRQYYRVRDLLNVKKK